MYTDEIFRRRRLPHWDYPGAIYFVTTCLQGSIPAQGLLDIHKYRERLDLRSRPIEMNQNQWDSHKWKLAFAHTDDWLDRRPAVRHLVDPRLAQVVIEAMYHFAGERYDLLAYVVMPSHLHWVFRPIQQWVAQLGSAANQRTPRERIMHSLKLFTARCCNSILGCEGAFWQDESYDHCVFDMDELERISHYVERNPLRAGLVESPEKWIFSSARDREIVHAPFGHPLCRPECIGRSNQ